MRGGQWWWQRVSAKCYQTLLLVHPESSRAQVGGCRAWGREGRVVNSVQLELLVGDQSFRRAGGQVRGEAEHCWAV